nr:MAG TPA: hypothetical protein [Caudoviricetes sp.]
MKSKGKERLRIEQCSGAMAKNGSASLRKGTVQKGSA